jgi:penicillin-binding protein 2
MVRWSANIPHGRLRLTYALMAIILVFFIGRLFILQILEGAHYQYLADRNRFITVSIAAPRGIIYDRNGFQLVRNVPSFNVMITPALLPDSEAEIEAIYRRLSELTGVPIDQEGDPAAPCVPGRGILQLVLEGDTNSPYDAWHIACDVDETIARILREEQVDLPGVSVEAVPIREYTTGNLTAAIIGYLGPIPASLEEYYVDLGFRADRDKIGYDGIEYWYQEILAGQNGQKEVERDVAGQQLRQVGIVTQPVPGNSLRLTIDTRLQSAAETALINRMEKRGHQSAGSAP